MALGPNRPLTEMSTGKLPGGKGRSARKTDILRLSRNFGNLEVSQSFGPPRPVTGTVLLYYLDVLCLVRGRKEATAKKEMKKVIILCLLNQ
jgi:hypothetical protein